MVSKYRVTLVKEGDIPYDSTIGNPLAAVGIINQYLDGVDREHFVVLLLNTKNQIIGINTVSIGALNSNIVHPREVYKPAIVANAASIILGHNHPSGDVKPSNEDVEMTRRIYEASKILGIPLLDHIIVGESYSSMKEMGLVF